MLAGPLAPFTYLYVPDVLLGEGDAVATAGRVRASENLLRAGIVAELYSVTVLVFAALALYELFKRVDPSPSLLMPMMMPVSVPISYVGALHDVAPLILLKNPAIATLLDPRGLLDREPLRFRAQPNHANLLRHGPVAQTDRAAVS